MVNYYSISTLKPKKLFYISICIISIISAILFLLTIKTNNRKINQNLLVNANILYQNYLSELNREYLENFKNYSIDTNKSFVSREVLDLLKEFAGQKLLFPFRIKILNHDISGSLTNFNERLNFTLANSEKNSIEEILFLNIYSIKRKELEYILDIIRKFAVYENKSSDTDTQKKNSIDINTPNNNVSNINFYSPLLNQIPVYKHVNLYFLKNLIQSEEENIIDSELENFLPEIKINNGLNFYIKYLYYKSDLGQINLTQDILYKEIKSFNSKQTFEELNDENSLNIIIHHNKSIKDDKIEIFYNKDINNDINSFNFENSHHKNLSNVIQKLIEIKSLNLDIKKSIQEKIDSEDLLDKIIEINKSHSVNFARLFTKSLDNLEKLNKIFSLYESIRTIDKIKEKFNYLQNILIQILKSNFELSSIDSRTISSFYLNTKYLMESNELVSYEHYFSNEFKIGMFLPVMLPIGYGLVKAVKALTAGR